jgi:NADH-quinone oxidoreductase subunit A
VPAGRAIVGPTRTFGTIFTSGGNVLDVYGHIAILVVVAIIFPLGALVTSWALQFVRIRPRVPSDPVKEDTYECGMVTEGPSLVQFNFRFYYIALLFLLFDVELVFLFPWATVFDEVGTVGFLKVLLFLTTFVVGGLYAWRKRAMEWG